MKRQLICSFVVLIASAGCFAGYSFDDVMVECWAGSGDNLAMVVIDYGSNGSYAFGYQWGDTLQTSYDALVAIDEVCEDFTLGSHWDDSVSGYFIDSLSYTVGDATFTMSGFDISFMTSADGMNWFTSWTGASDNYLANGDWDGWTTGAWVETSPGVWEFDGSVTTPVPEPATLLLLGLGAMVMRRKD